MKKRRSRGEGTIYFWDAKELWVGKLTLPDGKRRVKYAKSQKEVRDWLQVQQNAMRQGLLVKDENVTVADFFNNYMGVIGKHTLRPKTIESYSSLIRLHIVPMLGNIKLTALRPDHIQSLYSHKLENGLSKRTVHYIHSIIHKFLRQAVRWNLISKNVSDLVDVPRAHRRSPTVFNVDQVHAFLESTKGDRFFPLYALAIYTGLREGELLGLHRQDIDLVSSNLKVNHAVQYIIGAGVVISEPKTEKSRRPVTIPETAKVILATYLDTLTLNEGLIFTTASGKPINPRFLVKAYKAALVKAGLPNIRFHDLRHTSATLLLSANVHPKIVQERLGHSSITVTMDTYSSVIPSMQDQAAEKMDLILSRP